MNKYAYLSRGLDATIAGQPSASVTRLPVSVLPVMGLVSAFKFAGHGFRRFDATGFDDLKHWHNSTWREIKADTGIMLEMVGDNPDLGLLGDEMRMDANPSDVTPDAPGLEERVRNHVDKQQELVEQLECMQSKLDGITTKLTADAEPCDVNPLVVDQENYINPPELAVVASNGDWKSRYLDHIGYPIGGDESPNQVFEELIKTNSDLLPSRGKYQSLQMACEEAMKPWKTHISMKQAANAEDILVGGGSNPGETRDKKDFEEDQKELDQMYGGDKRDKPAPQEAMFESEAMMTALAVYLPGVHPEDHPDRPPSRHRKRPQQNKPHKEDEEIELQESDLEMVARLNKSSNALNTYLNISDQSPGDERGSNSDMSAIESEYSDDAQRGSPAPQGKQSAITGLNRPPQWVPKTLHPLWRDAVSRYVDEDGGDPTLVTAYDRVASIYKAFVRNYEVTAQKQSAKLARKHRQDHLSHVAMALFKYAEEDPTDEPDDLDTDPDVGEASEAEPEELTVDDKLDLVLDLLTDMHADSADGPVEEGPVEGEMVAE